MKSIPSRDQILRWVEDNPAQSSRRDIARAFGVKGAGRTDLKRLLRLMEDDGLLAGRRASRPDREGLPPVAVLVASEQDADGDLFLAPVEWRGKGETPRVLYVPKDGDPALGVGDRALMRLTEVGLDLYSHEGRLIRRLQSSPKRLLGVYRTGAEGGRLVPVGKGDAKEWRVPPGAAHGARDGELVEAEQRGKGSREGLPLAEVVERLGDPGAARSVSLIAIHEHGLRDAFPDAVLAEAEAAEPIEALGDREDLRALALITIDPEDARDHDDAVFAHADDDAGNPGGHVLWVAIADVAAYVTPGSELDREARLRGNSTYFPDRVVPMLPDRLSGELCSLHEGVERPCVAVRMVLGADGAKRAHRFARGLMRSPAALVYEEVQALRDGAPTERTAPHRETIDALYAAYEALRAARERREPLDLDLPERRIALDDAGTVTAVAYEDRLDAHRLIEECMVLANVAAAEELVARRSPLLFRVHEEPDADRLDALRETAEASGFSLPKGQVTRTATLNRLLREAQGSEVSELISLATLRSMQQAYYSPDNLGHFGLALRAYAHFTSPIRRYADLVVHRALIAAHGWGPDPSADGLSEEDVATLDATAKSISEAERRSMVAERDTNDRYLAAFLADRVGAEVSGRVSGVQAFGAFVKLDETGADGLVPVRSMGAEYFRHDREAETLTGADTGQVIGVGQRVTAKLAEADPLTGGLILELVEVAGEPMRRAKGDGARGKGAPKRGGPKRRLRKAPARRGR